MKIQNFYYCLGINILIFGSMIPVIHYYFYCSLKLKTIYISVLLVLSIASVIGTSSAACSKPQFRPFKAILFIALGLYGMKKFNFLFSRILFLFLFEFRCCSGNSCMYYLRFTTYVSHGIFISLSDGCNIYCRWCYLCSSCTRTIFSW